MRTKDVIFGGIEALWLAGAVAFVGLGTVVFCNIAAQNAADRAAIDAFIARERAIAAILDEVTRTSASALVAAR